MKSVRKGFLLPVLLACVIAQAAQQPNVIVILTDDHGFGDLGRYNDKIRTPNLDQLADDSVRFTQFYVHSACAPTRASLMTGRNNQEAGVWGVHGGRDFLHLDEVLLPEILGEHGYVSAMLGKWHLGKTRDRHPDQRGFTQQHMIVDRLYDDTDPVFMHDGVVSQPKGWSCDILTDLGLEFIEENKAQPFFLYMAYPQIHAPWYAPEEFIAPYRDEGYSEALSTLFGYITHFDTNVGRLLQGVEDLGIADDTIILYMHDNGLINNHERKDIGNGKRLEIADTKIRNVLMEKGGKGTSWEGGIHVPLFARYPAKFQPRDVETIAHVQDIFPSVLELCSIDHESKLPLEGRSLVPLLKGEASAWPDRYLTELKMDPLYDGMNRAESAGYTNAGYKVLQDKASINYAEQDFLAIRNQEFKFVRMGAETSLFKVDGSVKEWHSVINEYPEVAKMMDAQLQARFEAMIASPRSLSMPTFSIGGVNEAILAYAPIELLGNTKNEGKVLFDLKATGDGARYKIDVLEAGTYEIKLVNFTKWGIKPRSGDGAEISIHVGDQKVQAPAITQAVYPIGQLALPQGETVVTVRVASPARHGGAVFSRGIEKLIISKMK